MKAKDTVMGDEEIQGITNGAGVNMTPLDRKIAEAQAEITWPVAFKAGMKERGKWILPDELDRLEAAEQSGVQEVVEFLHLKLCDEFWLFNTDEWQAQLKDWHISA